MNALSYVFEHLFILCACIYMRGCTGGRAHMWKSGIYLELSISFHHMEFRMSWRSNSACQVPLHTEPSYWPQFQIIFRGLSTSAILTLCEDRPLYWNILVPPPGWPRASPLCGWPFLEMALPSCLQSCVRRLMCKRVSKAQDPARLTAFHILGTLVTCRYRCQPARVWG